MTSGLRRPDIVEWVAGELGALPGIDVIHHDDAGAAWLVSVLVSFQRGGADSLVFLRATLAAAGDGVRMDVVGADVVPFGDGVLETTARLEGSAEAFAQLAVALARARRAWRLREARN